MSDPIGVRWKHYFPLKAVKQTGTGKWKIRDRMGNELGERDSRQAAELYVAHLKQNPEEIAVIIKRDETDAAKAAARDDVIAVEKHLAKLS